MAILASENLGAGGLMEAATAVSQSRSLSESSQECCRLYHVAISILTLSHRILAAKVACGTVLAFQNTYRSRRANEAVAMYGIHFVLPPTLTDRQTS